MLLFEEIGFGGLMNRWYKNQRNSNLLMKILEKNYKYHASKPGVGNLAVASGHNPLSKISAGRITITIR